MRRVLSFQIARFLSNTVNPNQFCEKHDRCEKSLKDWGKYCACPIPLILPTLHVPSTPCLPPDSLEQAKLTQLKVDYANSKFNQV